MTTQGIKKFLDMSSEELNSYIKISMHQKFSSNRNIAHKHTDYLESSMHNTPALIDERSDKKVTINGAKFIDEVNEEDHLFTAGEFKNIVDGD